MEYLQSRGETTTDCKQMPKKPESCRINCTFSRKESGAELCEELRQTFERRCSILLDGLAQINGIRCNRLLDEQKIVCIHGSAFGACGEGSICIAYTCLDENPCESLGRTPAFAEN